MVIGLDISTSIVGIAVLNDAGQIHEIHHVDLRKISGNDYCAMADCVEEKLRDIKSRNPDIDFKVFVEEAGKKYRRGTSSASTIFKLARFNGIVCFVCWKIFGHQPTELEVKNSRKKIGLEIPKFAKGTKYEVKKKIIKETVMNFLLKEYKAEEMGFKKTNYDNWQVWCQDRADAIVIAKVGLKNKS